jgi:Helix-turn-helix domain
MRRPRFASSDLAARQDHTREGRPAGARENRRFPGLRREEVAVLAGVTVDYHTRLERVNNVTPRACGSKPYRA